jgi:predicted nucleic acid-binding Zn ribbon protein
VTAETRVYSKHCAEILECSQESVLSTALMFRISLALPLSFAVLIRYMVELTQLLAGRGIVPTKANCDDVISKEENVTRQCSLTHSYVFKNMILTN